MKEFLDFNSGLISGSDITYDSTASLMGNKAWKITSKNEGIIEFNGSGGFLAGVQFTTEKYLVIPIYFSENHSVNFRLEFYENKKSNNHAYTDVAMGVMPDIEVLVIYKLQNLDLKTLFLKRTPGRLKNTSTGTPTRAEKLDSFILKIPASNEKQTITIGNPYLSDIFPEISIPKKSLVDKLGQWKMKEWKGKTKDEAELIRNYRNWLAEDLPPVNDTYSAYGGDMSRQYTSKGFFSTVCEDGIWYLTDPDGYRFYSVGVDCVNPNAAGPVDGIESLFEELPPSDGIYADAWHKRRDTSEVCFQTANLIRAFGKDWHEAWTKLAAKRMRHWGFNTVANWSEKNFGKENKIPYVTETPFPSTKTPVFRDFPDVFAKEYSENAVECAKYLDEYKDDKYLIGYFLRNEPNWAFGKYNLAKLMLENGNETASKYMFIVKMAEKYKTVADFNNAWNQNISSFEEINAINEIDTSITAVKTDTEEFTRELIKQYIKVPSLACRAVDPNHMNLGMRWAWIASEDFYLGSEYFDIFSINCYRMTPDPAEIGYIHKKTGKPVMIGEFHAGALDVGLPCNALQGVQNQSERGYFYSYYMEQGALIPALVGAHYFQFNDQAVLGRFDGENLNIGLADICGKPYEDMTDKIRATNARIYKVRSKEIKATERQAVRAVKEGF